MIAENILFRNYLSSLVGRCPLSTVLSAIKVLSADWKFENRELAERGSRQFMQVWKDSFRRVLLTKVYFDNHDFPFEAFLALLLVANVVLPLGIADR